MKKRVFIIHGWGGSPCGWLLWIKEELEKRGFKVEAPQMPNKDEPEIETWVGFLSKLAGKVSKNDYFFGYSLGCQTIMRYLQDKEEVGGIVLVAGFFNLTQEDYENKEDEEIAKPWLETPINLEKLKKQKIIAIFSDDDPLVPLNDAEIFKEKLNAEIIIEKNKGHFDNVYKFTNALNAVLKLAK